MSSSSSLLSSSPMTLLSQEIDHSNSSSSSSTATPMTSSTETDHSDHLWQSCLAKSVERQVRINKPKTPNQKKRITSKYEQTRIIPTYRNGCKNLENLVDDRVLEHRDSLASSSHGLSLELTRSADLGKHSVYTHFPKDRNCEICQRTKITRAPCRRRNGEAVPRAVNFGDLITADHKVLSDNCESRNNHRYAVVVQDLATQWIQAYPCKNKTSQETREA